ncbi:hypothetical protein GGS20DRAFT_7619 [Poronia punctata]|nr:hypothetical protein GGS20DRAFT_7619 [Poronia punctata]
MSSIVVQPPTQSQRGSILYPPLVVQTPEQSAIFLQVLVYDSHDNILSGDSVQGSMTRSPAMLPEELQQSQGGAGTSTATENYEFTIFNDIVIRKAGTYRLVVNRYSIDYTVGESIHIDQVVSRPVRVRKSGVALESPSIDEQKLLDSLREGHLMA